MPEFLKLWQLDNDSFLMGTSSSVVLAVLVLAYLTAGLVLLINLHKNSLLKGNSLGVAASAIFLFTGLTYLAALLLPNETQAEIIARQVVYGINFLVLLSFIIASLRTQFLFGDYNVLIAARKQLEQQERWMHLMQENMTDGLAVYSPSGNLLYINPAAAQMLHLDINNLNQGRLAFASNYMELAPTTEAIEKVLGGESVNTKVKLIETGREKVIDIKLAPVYGKFKKVIAVTAAYRDVTEVFRLERAKEEFVQIASHELRTPLTAARGFLALLQMDKYGELGEKQRALVDKSLTATGKLSKLIDNILMVARIEESRVGLNPELFNIDEVIKSVMDEMQGEADRCAINIRLLMPKQNLPEIFADKDKIYHVLSNIVSNSIKYTPEGGHVFIEPRLKNDLFEISISDTGIGIAKEDLDKLFNKFERINSDRSVKVGGSGLGLVIVKSFVELHGGKVSVNSRQGSGTTFTIHLPLKRVIYG